MGLSGAGSLRPRWLPPIMPVLSLRARYGSRPDTNTGKRENVGGSTPTFRGGGPHCLAVAQPLSASFLFPRTGEGTAHLTPLKLQGSCPSPGDVRSHSPRFCVKGSAQGQGHMLSFCIPLFT